MSGPAGFQPHVSPYEQPPELTVRAVLLGAVLGIVFGASSTYLALRVGLTVSASVPIAVIAIALLRQRHQQRAILEHNITQTVGSAGESVAAALVFTVPALIFLGYPLRVELSTLIALTGGMLGVLMMVPLRRYLIVKEHGVLRYPEGKACAEILIAGEKGGMSARKVFAGMAVGAAFKAFQGLLGGVKGTLSRSFAFFKGASLACDIDPTLLGVGYIIGYRTSLIMVSGSLLASLILVPIIVLFGSGSSEPLAPATELIRNMQPADVWDQYVRHIGAGAVATGGIFGLIRALPVILSSIRASARSLTGGAAQTASLRTDRDTPTPVLVLGALGIVAFITALPLFKMNLLGAVLILVLGFLFSVVSSRITGEVGSTSSPLSGMTIGVLMATCGVFLAIGWEGSAYSRLALMIGAVVCIAISNAGTCSQDLKTGFLVGSTPVRQQGALLIGVLTSVLAVGWTAYGLNNADATQKPLDQPFQVKQELIDHADTITSRTDGRTYRYVRLAQDEAPAGMKPGVYLVNESSGKAEYFWQDGVGGPRFPAPQARLMSVVIDGLLTHRLPWNLILIGVAIALFMELLGFGSLTFAVGVYLPLSSTMPVFVGGVVRKLCDKIYRRPPDDEAEKEGTLFCSGLIAGASIVGILAAMQGFLPGFDANTLLHPDIALLLRLMPAWDNPVSDLWAVVLLAALGFLMFRAAREPQDSA
ncbi:MAG: oligopeptide transporter, OPT family [Acidobacteria bacterium]|nr:MAG: oligopeptide transporter, OPT family [Acidobacteriota bacterium]